MTAIPSLQEVLSYEEEATEVEEGVEQEDDRVRVDVRSAARTTSHLELFQHPDAHPFVLDLALMRKYGPEWLIWEPELLEEKILVDFKTRSISDLNVDKLQAIKTLHLVDTFWETWTVFVPCAMALSGVPAEFRVMQTLTVPQLMIAVDLASKLRTDLVYSLEIKTFMAVVHVHDGMLCPIEPLVDLVSIDSSRYDVDCDKVREAWDEVRKTGKAPSKLDPESVQLQRMLEAWQILEESRRQLHDQLPLIYDV